MCSQMMMECFIKSGTPAEVSYVLSSESLKRLVLHQACWFRINGRMTLIIPSAVNRLHQKVLYCIELFGPEVKQNLALYTMPLVSFSVVNKVSNCVTSSKASKPSALGGTSLFSSPRWPFMHSSGLTYHLKYHGKMHQLIKFHEIYIGC